MLAIPQRRALRRDTTRPVRNIIALAVGLLVVLIWLRHDELGPAQQGIENKHAGFIVDHKREMDPIKIHHGHRPWPSPIVVNVDNAMQSKNDAVVQQQTAESEASVEQKNQVSKTKTSGTPLDKILSKYRVEKTVRDPADYNNPDFDAHAAAMIKDISPRSRDPVEMSLLLMTRPGHRHRVGHLIGGDHLSWEVYRQQLIEKAHVFAPFQDKVQVVSQRDLDAQPISCGFACGTGVVPCRPTGARDASASITSMENVVCQSVNRPFGLCMSPQLLSDVPLLYISYHDFGVMKPAPDKPKTGLAAAYISNCAFAKRNSMVQSLVALTKGRVHSFGRCLPSGHSEPPVVTNGGPQGQKLAVLETYKFSLAFENSESNDYVTEKFFGALCSSAVPVVIGAPNIKFFAPDTTPYPYESKALLHSADFNDDPERLAKILMELDENKEAYDEMLEWKKRGYSDDYKALVDIGDVHSDCRACIAAADDVRRRDGPSAYDINHLKDVLDVQEHDFALFVRERGSYAYTRLGFKGKPLMKDLVRKALAYVPLTEKNLWKDNQDLRNKPTRVYAFYLPRPGRLPVLSDQDLAVLPNGCELEMICV